MTRLLWRLVLCHLLVGLLAAARGEGRMKSGSTFYGEKTLAVVRANVKGDPLLAEFARAVVARARPWREMTDEGLWSLMFGPTITRSWMVWSDGWCPACKGSVPMYEWKMDALDRPWKVECPRCREFFPKNDFAAFYRSGLGKDGVFDPTKADRKLLFNTEHPGADDPLHAFGVDDGVGYSDGEHLWRFIGAYLVYGQWKQAVLGGINNLAAAYVVTGDPVYAHQAGILLDRVADLYPSFDFDAQAFNYERKLGSKGYVSTWHDACEETRELALAYDMVYGGIARDNGLVAFLSEQAKAHGLPAKTTFADVQRNIEAGLLRDPLANHPEKIQSNYPRTEIALAIIESVLDWPGNRAAVMKRIDAMVAESTKADGVTGEKGLGGYAAGVVQGLAQFLQQMAPAEPDLLRTLIARQPVLRQTWRFHIDTLCLDGYYPTCGDADWFAGRHGRYAGVGFQRFGKLGAVSPPRPPLAPSMYSFLWNLYRATGDPAYVQVLYRGNDNTTDNLPWDPFCADPETMRKGVQAVIAEMGTDFSVGSVNKEQWRLAILRSGTGKTARAAWLDYDWTGRHSHCDGMNLGLYAYGLDLLPDFGYPPVNYGGWDSPRALWYTRSEAHHTVTVDGRQFPGWAHDPVGGKTTLWADGQGIRAVRASAPGVYADCAQFERTVFLVDLSPEQFYLLDIFRVVGGSDHLKCVGSSFGAITTAGVNPTEAVEPPGELQVRNVKRDPAPPPGWSVEWKIDDRYGLREKGADVHLRYTDLTAGAQAMLGEAWVSTGSFNAVNEAWVPRVMVHRSAAEPLTSAFVAVLEPYEKQRALQEIRRLPLVTKDGEILPDTCAAVELTGADGARGLLVSVDAEDAVGAEVRQPEWNLSLQGEACYLQRNAEGRLTRAALFHGTRLTTGDFTLIAKQPIEFLEVAVTDGTPAVVAGDADAVAELQLK